MEREAREAHKKRGFRYVPCGMDGYFEELRKPGFTHDFLRCHLPSNESVKVVLDGRMTVATGEPVHNVLLRGPIGLLRLSVVLKPLHSHPLPPSPVS